MDDDRYLIFIDGEKIGEASHATVEHNPTPMLGNTGPLHATITDTFDLGNTMTKMIHAEVKASFDIRKPGLSYADSVEVCDRTATDATWRVRELRNVELAPWEITADGTTVSGTIAVAESIETQWTDEIGPDTPA